jgi:hypothetical protein
MVVSSTLVAGEPVEGSSLLARLRSPVSRSLALLLTRHRLAAPKPQRCGERLASWLWTHGLDNEWRWIYAP